MRRLRKETREGIARPSEVGINQHWSWKAEYLYYDLRRESITANPVPANPPFQVGYTRETRANTFNPASKVRSFQNRHSK